MPSPRAGGGARRTDHDAGREALAEWIRSPDLVNEMRDEGLLKVFFAGAVEREDAIAVLEAPAKYAEKHARCWRSSRSPRRASTSAAGGPAVRARQ